ncbi:hypothetical protein Tco_0443356 [Tanacetum coccineum]
MVRLWWLWWPQPARPPPQRWRQAAEHSEAPPRGCAATARHHMPATAAAAAGKAAAVVVVPAVVRRRGGGEGWNGWKGFPVAAAVGWLSGDNDKKMVRIAEEEAGSMGEPTMEEFMGFTQSNYDWEILEDRKIEFKRQLLIELGKNAFSGINGKDAVMHIEIFLEVIDLIKVPKEVYSNVKSELDNFKFAQWLASKFRNHEKMGWHIKNTLWAYWRRGDDEEVISDDKFPKDENLTDEDEIA